MCVGLKLSTMEGVCVLVSNSAPWRVCVCWSQTQHHGGCVCVGLKLSTMEGRVCWSQTQHHGGCVCVLVSNSAPWRVCVCGLKLRTMEGRVCAGLKLGTMEGVCAGLKLSTMEGVCAGLKLNTMEGVCAGLKLSTMEGVCVLVSNSVPIRALCERRAKWSPLGVVMP